MAAIDPNGDEQYYFDCFTYEGLRLPQTKVGEVKYWVDGYPEENLTPPNNEDTGKFFMFF